MSAQEVERIFLSATVLDCGRYRTDLKAYVENFTDGVKIDLQKHWAGGAADVVSACKAKFDAQDAYLGLFGHRYGWVPAGFEPDSITKLEWRWAVERWKAQREPPIFIFRPRKGALAHSELDTLAEAAFDQQAPPASAPERSASRASQAAFMADIDAWAQVAGGRIMEFFESAEQLQQRAAKAITCWNLRLLRQASRGARPGAGQIPASEFGRIGRETDFTRVQEALEALADAGRGAALSVAVHGDEFHGQLEFAAALGQQVAALEEADGGELAALDPLDPHTLARRACECLRRPSVTADPLAELAEALAARLKQRHVLLVLGGLGAAADRWTRFVQSFWQPLLAALAQRGMPAPGGRRLVWCVVDHQPAPLADKALFWDGAHDAAALDTRRVLPLPAFGTLDARRVERWLAALKKEYPGQFPSTLDEAHRKAIAASATHPDGLPAFVYQRLQRDGFWGR